MDQMTRERHHPSALHRFDHQSRDARVHFLTNTGKLARALLVLITLLLAAGHALAADAEGTAYDNSSLTLLVKPISGDGFRISKDEILVTSAENASMEDGVVIVNFRDAPINLSLSLDGVGMQDLVKLAAESLVIPPKSESGLSLVFYKTKGVPGTYTGRLVLGGDLQVEIPIVFTIRDTSQQIDTFMFDTKIAKEKLSPGSMLEFKVDLFNLPEGANGSAHVDYKVVGSTAGNSSPQAVTWEEDGEITTLFLKSKTVRIPKDFKEGGYTLYITANYGESVSQGTAFFTVELPFFGMKVGFIPVWVIFAAILLFILGIFALIIMVENAKTRKRFKLSIDFGSLPKQSDHSLFFGKVAESPATAYFNPQTLLENILVVGSTGSGRTVTAKIIAEECLRKGIAVAVFDPKAKWTGMLRKCANKKMLKHYPGFRMQAKEALAFTGNIRIPQEPTEKLDVIDRLEPGEIQIYVLNRFEIDKAEDAVVNAIQEILGFGLEECKELKALLIFEEVDRFIPKWGGTGRAYTCLQWACRELGKFGIGVMLISHLYNDFVEDFKAKLSTTIQMRTKDEGDLKALRLRFGEDIVYSLVKSPIGTGLLVHPQINKGLPYFISFRPILHSTELLGDDELEKYRQYNEVVQLIRLKIDRLKERGLNLADKEIELKMITQKIVAGDFNVVDIYLKELTPYVEKQLELNQVPEVRLARQRVDPALLEQAVLRADQSRAAFEDKNLAEQKKTIRPLKFDENVLPEHQLMLADRMIMLNLNMLMDELKSMKPTVYNTHVTKDKNDFADWLLTACHRPLLAEKMRKAKTREDIVELMAKVRKEYREGIKEEEKALEDRK